MARSAVRSAGNGAFGGVGSTDEQQPAQQQRQRQHHQHQHQHHQHHQHQHHQHPPQQQQQQEEEEEEQEPRGRTALRNVLLAYVAHNRGLGYCQALNYVGGMLLLLTDLREELAFFLLIHLTEHCVTDFYSKYMYASVLAHLLTYSLTHLLTTCDLLATVLFSNPHCLP